MMTRSLRAALELASPPLDERPVHDATHSAAVFALSALSEWVDEMARALQERPRDDALLDVMDGIANTMLARAGAALVTYRQARDCGGQA